MIRLTLKEIFVSGPWLANVIQYNIDFLSRFSTLFPGRSSRPEVFCQKDVLKNFAKLTGE